MPPRPPFPSPQCLDEDWYPDVRLAAAVVEGALLDALGPGLDDDQRRAIYPELLKRLDDSSNQVWAERRG